MAFICVLVLWEPWMLVSSNSSVSIASGIELILESTSGSRSVIIGVISWRNLHSHRNFNMWATTGNRGSVVIVVTVVWGLGVQ